MQKIEDYFVIGDLHSCALVSKNASIDWLCLPHFDSSSIFAKLLDKNAGSFFINGNYDVSAVYKKDTAIVEYKFKNKTSEFNLEDFMVPQPVNKCDHHFLVRKFIGVSLSTVSLIFNPKSNYGKDSIVLDYEKNLQVLKTLVDGQLLELHLPKNSLVKKFNQGYEINFEIAQGEVAEVVLEYSPVGKCKNTKNFFLLKKQTEDFWKKWVSKGKFFDFCREQLVRSAITLKLMQFYPTGAIVASPTTSLPEEIGGIRNWDYRYVWIRDATFVVYGFYVLGYLDEATHFFKFIRSIGERCMEEDFDVSLMYTIYGEIVPQEKSLNHLSGYKNSKPVRIGNSATKQFQLDVYGALIDAHYFVSRRHMKISQKDKQLILKLVDKIEELWQKKDNGIWEVRKTPQNFTYSKVMAWVGADRALRMGEKLNLTDDEKMKCRMLADLIHDWIWRNCFDDSQKNLTQFPGTKAVDATNFLFVLLQFLNKRDPLTKVIIENTFKKLSYEEIFIYRYLTNDGLKGKEGAFLLCSFWMIASFAILEDVEKAGYYFDKFEKFMNQQSLLSEEIDTKTKEYLGNYPQAFSHLGFIMGAYYLDRYNKKLKVKPDLIGFKNRKSKL